MDFTGQRLPGSENLSKGNLPGAAPPCKGLSAPTKFQTQLPPSAVSWPPSAEAPPLRWFGYPNLPCLPSPFLLPGSQTSETHASLIHMGLQGPAPKCSAPQQISLIRRVSELHLLTSIFTVTSSSLHWSLSQFLFLSLFSSFICLI